MKFRRGTAAKSREDYAAAQIVVLGGPTNLCGRDFYTCMALEEGSLYVEHGRLVAVKPGREFMVPGHYIETHRQPLLWTEHAIQIARKEIARQGWTGAYGSVIENWCPECEIDDMIFYGEDYICAWCREQLEK